MLRQNKTAGAFTILSGLIAFASLLLSAICVNYHFEAFTDPSLILTLPNLNIEACKWSMICDMLGYYMLLLPLIFYIHAWMRLKTPWSSAITFCGVAYVLIGSIGASILAAVWPTAMHDYALAPAAEQAVIKANFNTITSMVYNGMWNLLEQLFAAAWWILTGIFLFRHGTKGVAILAIITGLSSFFDSLAASVGIEVLHQSALTIYLYGAIVWAIWTGIVIHRKPLVISTSVRVHEVVEQNDTSSALAAMR